MHQTRARTHTDPQDGLTFCDFSSFYAPTAGGIRTYHDAKLAWFANQDLHRYCLIHPGKSFSVRRITPLVTVVTTYGLSVRAGYRLPVDWRAIRSTIKDLQPDVLETGDPWVSGPLALWFRRSGDIRGVVSSFFHSNPVHTYVDPWVARATRSKALRTRLATRADGFFYRTQRKYDLTLASSAGVERQLRQHGIRHVLSAPFGVDPRFLAVGQARRRGDVGSASPRLLYAGRLQADKSFDLMLEALPRLLNSSPATVTIVGFGPLASTVKRLGHPRVRYLGYIADRDQLAQIYADHSVLLAPGPHETFGLSVLEALAAGLTVVGPRAGGTGELLAQLNEPFFFETDNATSLIAMVGRALDGTRQAQIDDAVGVAERHGTWADAVEREVEGYCEFLSRYTTSRLHTPHA